MHIYNPKLSHAENDRQAAQEELVRLQTEKLRRDQFQNQNTRSSNGQGDKSLALLIGLIFTVIASLFIFAIKYPKTFIVFLVLGYGTLQFLAPAQGAEFNRWAVTLFSNPGQARSELLTTLGSLDSGTSTGASPVDYNSTVSSAENDPQTAPVNTLPVAAPTPAAPTVNPMCSKFSWSNSDDLPYLQYYKCPNPNAGK
jgi:hypothetical protein